MKVKFGRNAHKTGYSVDVEPASDIFEQPEKSLLGEAFSRPLGIWALFVLLLAIGVFLANHFMYAVERVNDYALVAFFVSGAVLLSILLRSGEPKTERPKRNTPKPASPSAETGLVFEDEKPAFAATNSTYRQNPGFAEPLPSDTPIPAGAMTTPTIVGPADDDDEVAGYERALLHYAERGDLHGQGEILRRLGHTAKARGHLSESREFYVNSRNCFKETEDHYAEAAVLLDLGQVLESLGEHDAASAAYRDANRALLDVAMNSSGRDTAFHAQAAD